MCLNVSVFGASLLCLICVHHMVFHSCDAPGSGVAFCGVFVSWFYILWMPYAYTYNRSYYRVVIVVCVISVCIIVCVHVCLIV